MQVLNIVYFLHLLEALIRTFLGRLLRLGMSQTNLIEEQNNWRISIESEERVAQPDSVLPIAFLTRGAK